MNILGNILWLLFGGLFTALGYFIGGLLLCITIIGIPFGVQLFKLGTLALWPFGYTSVASDRAGGCLYVIVNIIWALTGGISLALSHLFFGAILCITIIGIPFGMQHFKLMPLAFTPFGRDIIPAE